jgi:hypothetical protein
MAEFRGGNTNYACIRLPLGVGIGTIFRTGVDDENFKTPWHALAKDRRKHFLEKRHGIFSGYHNSAIRICYGHLI